MNRFFSHLTITLITIFCLLITISPSPAHAQSSGLNSIMAGTMSIDIMGFEGDCAGMDFNSQTALENYLGGRCDEENKKHGLLPAGGEYMAMLYQQQPSSREYIADILDNVGIPQVSSAYAQGTGYSAMSPFLSFWKSFRNLAYSLYIIMFVVVGVMIMLRTKINAQTVITVQSALPNLVITLLLITFSYAIVGFMIDLMYFAIYATVYLISAAGIISTPTKAITRLMSYSAWSVIFEGRNSIISAVSLAIKEVLSGVSNLSMGARIGVGVATAGISEILANGFFYLLAAVWIGISMIKLIFVLFKSYIMLIIQTVTAPVQLLMNAMPGSEAFANWIKKTASYLIPFPVAAAMFIMAAVFIGDPTQSTILEVGNSSWAGDANPFGIDQSHECYDSSGSELWLPPFTFTGSNSWQSKDLMVLLGFFIFTMTPASVKMAQEWLQVKESPYTAEAFSGAGAAIGLGKAAYGWKTGLQHQREANQQLDYQKQMAAGIEALKSKP